MNFLDIIIVVPLLWALYKGFKKGLIIEIASLAALLLGIYGGIHFSDAVAGFLQEKFDWNSQYMPLISFTITFLGIVLLVYTIGKVIEKIVDIVALGIANKILGAVFGLLKVAFILSVVIIIFDNFDSKMKIIDQEKKENSMLYKPLKSFSVAVIPKLKFDEMNNAISNSIDSTYLEEPIEDDTDSTTYN